MVEILHFIERSNAKLQTFECRSNLSGLSEELLLNLLSVLDTSKIVRLPCVQHGSTLANALSDENVLPNVEDLTIFDIDSLPHSFVPFLSSRLEREATRGRFKLKRFALYTRRADPANERERLKEIGKKYGVACTAQKFYFKRIFY
ncbi:hypothetical protein H0H92_015886 [Tricholoma furcatifolium]|nr:hypothetical protein H0H92_015886 [Tricholoma furcatifolium]